MLELVGALAAHSVEVIARAGVLERRMTAVEAVGWIPQLVSALSPSPAALNETGHRLRMPHPRRPLMPFSGRAWLPSAKLQTPLAA